MTKKEIPECGYDAARRLKTIQYDKTFGDVNQLQIDYDYNDRNKITAVAEYSLLPDEITHQRVRIRLHDTAVSPDRFKPATHRAPHKCSS